jgi:hypothetical protein
LQKRNFVGLEGKRGEGEGNFGSGSTIKGDIKN